MSRNYSLQIKISLQREFTQDEIDNLFSMLETWGITQTYDLARNDGEEDIYIYDDVNLCGGQGEEEAHNELSQEIKEIISDCRVKTQWTYLEDLPYEEYGEDFDEDD